MLTSNDFDLGFDEDTHELHIAFVAAEFVGSFLFRQHRGVIDCDDRFIVFGNDGYQHDKRSQREVEIVMEHLSEDQPVLGVDDEGYSWAVVVTDYSRTKFDKEELTKMVMNAWMVACDEALEAKLKG